MPDYVIRIEGDVQGVGYRAFTKRMAVRLDITGYVRNVADGTVIVHAQGRKSAVDDLVEQLRNGPPAARVRAVTVQAQANQEKFDAFEVDHDAD